MNPCFRVRIRTLGALGLTALIVACGGGGGGGGSGGTENPRGIVGAAAANPTLSSFSKALAYASQSNDLVNTLSGPGSFTVLAPNNAAFDALAVELLGPGKTVNDLLVPGNEAFMRSVLQYHVLATRLVKSSMQLGKSIEPILGNNAFFKIDSLAGSAVLFDGRARASGIESFNVDTSNGVIHIVTKLMLPADQSIFAQVSDQPQLSSLVAALRLASDNEDLTQLLSQPGRYTLFAPTNAAFDALAVEWLGAGNTAAELLVPANKALVRTVLEYHLLGSRLLRAEWPAGQPLDPVLAGNASFTVNAGGLTITDARNRIASVSNTDLFANNGVVHQLSIVILPPQ
ncbi:MAG: fasciclin domain-containing protein [Burkholderiales bacterium]|nr:fasciclin domain-containing protein [Burkholderiales bacterium]